MSNVRAVVLSLYRYTPMLFIHLRILSMLQRLLVSVLLHVCLSLYTQRIVKMNKSEDDEFDGEPITQEEMDKINGELYLLRAT